MKLKHIFDSICSLLGPAVNACYQGRLYLLKAFIKVSTLNDYILLVMHSRPNLEREFVMQIRLKFSYPFRKMSLSSLD